MNLHPAVWFLLGSIFTNTAWAVMRLCERPQPPPICDNGDWL